MERDMGIRDSSLVVLAIVLCCPVLPAHEPWPPKTWPSAMPRDVGLDFAALAEMDANIVKGEYTYVDSFTVIRHGKIAFDRSYPRDYEKIYGEMAKKQSPIIVHDRTGPFNPFNSWWHPYYRRGDLHTLQSITKALVSVIIGVAVTRGEFPDLDTPVMKFFDPKKVANLDDRKRRMTIRHLLTMTSGVEWRFSSTPISDGGTDTDTPFEASYDWVKFAIDRPMAEEPGKIFNYASGNVQILVHISNAAVGTDIEEYAAKHLFAPLGIENFYWKRTPAGVVDASGGLYLRPHDLAKIGHLYLRRGVLDGKRIVAADWVKDSVTGHVDTPKIFKDSRWGYLWGTMPYGEKGQYTVFGTGGFGGQGMIVFPDLDAVVVYTSWNVLDDQEKLSPPKIIDWFPRTLARQQPPPTSPACELVPRVPIRPVYLFPRLHPVRRVPGA
jgi:hypothetical protein